jgi:hypothetical protein
MIVTKLTEKKSNTLSKFLTHVPLTQKQSHRWEKTAFKEPEQNSHDDERWKTTHKSCAEAYYPPTESNDWDDSVELEPFNEERGWELWSVSSTFARATETGFLTSARI